jgi:LmbE family N-acetylglucosaminyl deacetylase
MKARHILIVTAHLDDVEIGMGGTCAKLCKHNIVHLLTMCKGDRPGCEHVANFRLQVTRENAEELGIRTVHTNDFSDVQLDKEPQLDIVNVISSVINQFPPDVIYTHYNKDVHKDHCIVSDAVRVAARLRKSSPVDELYEFTIPGSTEWGYSERLFNVFEDIEGAPARIKMKAISRYTTELRPSPDPVSLDMIDARDRYHGSLCGYTKAEAFKLVFKR